MNRFLAFGYILIGFLGGYVFGRSSAESPLSSFVNLLTALAVLGVFALWQWLEKAIQDRRSKNWETTRKGGKWRFVILRYVLARGLLLVAVITTPVVSWVGLTQPLLIALTLAIVLLFSTFAYIGHQEWTDREREYQANPTLKAARTRIAESQ